MSEGNIVKEFYVGNAKIKIADDFCVSQNETQQILKNIAAQVQWQLISNKKEKK